MAVAEEEEEVIEGDTSTEAAEVLAGVVEPSITPDSYRRGKQMS